MQLLLYRLDLKCRDLPAEAAEIGIACDRPGRVTIQKIDETHCNPLKLWEEMGSPMDMKPADAKKIDEASALTEEDLPFSHENGQLRLTTELGVNDVQLIKIYRK